MTVIAMTREMGTRGKEVAKHLVDRLDVQLVHHELVEAPFDRLKASSRSEVHRFLNGDAENGEPGNSTPAINGYMTPEEIFTLASRGNIIFRGWGAARLLHSIPHILSVRICAPMEDRVNEMMKRLEVDEGVARHEIERSDASHTTAFTRFFEADWRDPQNYDLVLNTAHLAPEVCADMLINAVRSPAFIETDASRSALADRLTEARINSLLRNAGVVGASSNNVYVSVSDGVAMLFGAVRDSGAAREIEKAVRIHTGINMVQNRIQTIGPYANA
jgi:cytidylate kinase